MDLKKHIQDHRSEFDEHKVSQRADVSFEALLKKELHQPKKGRVIYMKYFAVAASVALLVTTAMWFYDYQQEVEKRTEIISNLEDTSTGTRLEAVYEFTDDFKKEDQQIIDVLIEKLLNDTNANVKIAIVDALLDYPSNEKIRQSIIQALEKETKPNVQIKLIKALRILKETRAQGPLEEIIKDDTTFDIVKNNATLAMADLKK
jgi:hypothetical protein